MRIFGVGAVVVLGVLLGGCAGAPAAAPSKDTGEAVFLDQWAAEFPNAKPDAAIRVAKGICEDYKAGTAFRSEVDYLMSNGADASRAGKMIGMATATYCPEFNARK